jgi:hypothetical protein
MGEVCLVAPESGLSNRKGLQTAISALRLARETVESRATTERFSGENGELF